QGHPHRGRDGGRPHQGFHQATGPGGGPPSRLRATPRARSPSGPESVNGRVAKLARASADTDPARTSRQSIAHRKAAVSRPGYHVPTPRKAPGSSAAPGPAQRTVSRFLLCTSHLETAMDTTVIEVADLAKCLHEDLGLEVVCSNFYGRPMHRIVVLGPGNDFDVLIDEGSIQAADSHDHTET